MFIHPLVAVVNIIYIFSSHTLEVIKINVNTEVTEHRTLIWVSASIFSQRLIHLHNVLQFYFLQ